MLYDGFLCNYIAFNVFRKVFAYYFFSNIFMLLIIKGLGAQYIFKTCLRDGTPSRSDLEFINKQKVRPYLRKKKDSRF